VDILNATLLQLGSWTRLSNKLHRYRALVLLNKILSGVEQAEQWLQEVVVRELAKVVLERLEDADKAVRAAAVNVLHFLRDPDLAEEEDDDDNDDDEKRDEILAALLQVMEEEPTQVG
jgi:hypothetical protein